MRVQVAKPRVAPGARVGTEWSVGDAKASGSGKIALCSKIKNNNDNICLAPMAI